MEWVLTELLRGFQGCLRGFGRWVVGGIAFPQVGCCWPQRSLPPDAPSPQNLPNPLHQTVVAASKVALTFLKGLSHRPFAEKALKGGDKIDLGGGHEIEFIMAPNLHWPDTMFSYDHATGAASGFWAGFAGVGGGNGGGWAGGRCPAFCFRFWTAVGRLRGAESRDQTLEIDPPNPPTPSPPPSLPLTTPTTNNTKQASCSRATRSACTCAAPRRMTSTCRRCCRTTGEHWGFGGGLGGGFLFLFWGGWGGGALLGKRTRRG